MFATTAQSFLYARVAKPFFFRRDAEAVHDRVLAVGRCLGRSAFTRSIASALWRYEHPALHQEVLGIRFPNPIGLAAGFDKNAELTNILPSVGFGFVEVGSVTGQPCAGNPKPRLWRLPETRGLVVNYGLKNDGCDAIGQRLRGRQFAIPVGVSIAKTNSPATVDTVAGIADYVRAFRALHDVGDYVTVNISCPNAYGGEPFTDPERLDQLLAAIDAVASPKPIVLKLPADIAVGDLDALVRVADRHRVRGLIVSNLTKRRDAATIQQDELIRVGKGGISGKPVTPLANALLSHLWRTVGDRYVLIGCGGVFSAEDAYEKIRLGASLVQVITGMIFCGPQLIGEINHGLVRLLARDGFPTIHEAVGSAAPSARTATGSAQGMIPCAMLPDGNIHLTNYMDKL
jgi:dihydroorotate dehydrogenase subfamily 2